MRKHKNCKICDTHLFFDLDDVVYVHGQYYTKEEILKWKYSYEEHE